MIKLQFLIMLSVEDIKKILGDAVRDDKEAEEIRDGFRDLAELIFEKWLSEKRQKNENSKLSNNWIPRYLPP